MNDDNKYRICQSTPAFYCNCNTCGKKLITKVLCFKKPANIDYAFYRITDPPFTYQCGSCIGTGKVSEVEGFIKFEIKCNKCNKVFYSAFPYISKYQGKNILLCKQCSEKAIKSIYGKS